MINSSKLREIIREEILNEKGLERSFIDKASGDKLITLFENGLNDLSGIIKKVNVERYISKIGEKESKKKLQAVLVCYNALLGMK